MTETVTVSAGLEPNEKYRHVQELVQEVPEVAALGRHIISSPYAFHPHLLDISALTISQSLFAQALTVMQNTRLDYATAPYPQSFNWSAILEKLRSLSAAANIHWQSQNFYIVVFLSRIQESTDRLELGKLDERSHAEANKSGGLLKYWFGVPNPEGRNLATCIWRTRSDATPASSGAGHRQAAKATRNLYTEWKIKRYRLTVEEDVKGWHFENLDH